MMHKHDTVYEMTMFLRRLFCQIILSDFAWFFFSPILTVQEKRAYIIIQVQNKSEK